MATRWQRRLIFLLVTSLAVAAYFCVIADDPPSGSHGIRISTASSSPAPEKCEEPYGFLPCTKPPCTKPPRTCRPGASCCSRSWDPGSSAASSYPSSVRSPTRSSCSVRSLSSFLAASFLCFVHVPSIQLLASRGKYSDLFVNHITVSGLSFSIETAQSQVLIGMGLLAGSTVFLLTLLWGTCVAVGKCDLRTNNVSMDLQTTKGFSLNGTGITTDSHTSYIARLMGISVFPFIIAQFPTMFKKHKGRNPAVLLALIVSFLLLLAYCLFLVSHPWIQRRKLAYAKHKHVISGILKQAQMQSLGRLLNEDGTPNDEVIAKLFHKIDMDQSHSLSRSELHAFIVGVNFEEVYFDKADAVDKIMNDFDTSGNDVRSRQEHDLLVDRSDEVIENKGWYTTKAVLLLLLGAAVAAAFADPLVDTIHNFSNATHIPSFFISFIALPLATKSSEAISVIFTACRRKKKTADLAFSEVYGRVTMNNTMCLGLFLALIYSRNLSWEFSSELFIVLLVCSVVGLFTSLRTTYPLWTCLVAYMLYPLSLVIVYVLIGSQGRSQD
ncbi:hypothetical protein EJB05_33088, partial [Eragrostis curvula]